MNGSSLVSSVAQEAKNNGTEHASYSEDDGPAAAPSKCRRKRLRRKMARARRLGCRVVQLYKSAFFPAAQEDNPDAVIVTKGFQRNEIYDRALDKAEKFRNGYGKWRSFIDVDMKTLKNLESDVPIRGSMKSEEEWSDRENDFDLAAFLDSILHDHEEKYNEATFKMEGKSRSKQKVTVSMSETVDGYMGDKDLDTVLDFIEEGGGDEGDKKSAQKRRGKKLGGDRTSPGSNPPPGNKKRRQRNKNQFQAQAQAA